MARAAVFPGQGAQQVGMGRDVCDKYNSARETFAEANQLLGYDLGKLCFDGPDDKLNATDIQQPAIFTTSVAIFRAATESGYFKDNQFDAMAGLSLGEYTALHLAGAIPFADALKLVDRRGKLMQKAAEAAPGGMVSVMGLEENQVQAACERVQSSGRIRPANFNCTGQIVVSGDQAACEAIMPVVEELGGRGIPLKVAGAFHSELMRPAADEFRDSLASANFSKPRIRVVSNVDVADHTDPGAIRESLYRQIFNPVRWQESVEKLIADGCNEFWEVGPNRVLTSLMRKISREPKMTNVSAADAFAA
ncbi:MAG: ACP S-malonyltransferase [Phycisphaerae bacterium]